MIDAENLLPLNKIMDIVTEDHKPTIYMLDNYEQMVTLVNAMLAEINAAPLMSLQTTNTKTISQPLTDNEKMLLAKIEQLESDQQDLWNEKSDLEEELEHLKDYVGL